MDNHYDPNLRWTKKNNDIVLGPDERWRYQELTDNARSSLFLIIPTFSVLSLWTLCVDATAVRQQQFALPKTFGATTLQRVSFCFPVNDPAPHADWSF